jgi:ParB/RepB/Spo0J family partition protein
MKIPIVNISENPSALRKVNKDNPKYALLVASIAERGVVEPIIVKDLGSGKYQLIDGLHRFSAAQDAGLTEIPITIAENANTENDILVIQTIANLHKVETQPCEYSKQLERMLNHDENLTTAVLAKQLGHKEEWIIERLHLTKLPESISKLVNAGEISLRNAIVLSKLPADEQVAWLDKAMHSLTTEFVPEVSKRLKEIKEAKEQGKIANPPSYIQIPRARKFNELQTEADTTATGNALISKHGIDSAIGGWKAAIDWAISMDSITAENGKAAFDEKQKKDAELREKRIKETAEKKRLAAEASVKEAEIAAEKLAEIQAASVAK